MNTATSAPAIPKGEFGGECNRTACNTKGAYWYNYSTRLYYCTCCASVINRHNQADAIRLYGHHLCLKVDKPVEETT